MRSHSSNFFTDNEDLRFQLSQVDWTTLVGLQEGAFKDEDGFKDAAEARAFYEEILTSLGEFIAKEIAPHETELDDQHPILKDDGEVEDPKRLATIMKGLSELGAMGLTLPRRLGGMNCPLVVQQVVNEMMARADASVVGQFAFHGGIAQALIFYSLDEGSVTVEDGLVTKTRFDDVVTRIASGKEWGAMVLTEPHAGSDLGKISAKATQQKDGTWRLTGQKIYITAGHGDHHIVIARTEDEATTPGLKGLSLFYVPARLDKALADGGKPVAKGTKGSVRNFVIGGLEHKMGQHSCVAATIHYEDSYAELIGERGQGFRGMLLLMNNARVAVGFESVGTCEAAYRMARGYAEERVSMGKPIAQHEMIADYLDEMDVSLRALRALCFEAALNEELATRLEAQLKLKPPGNDDEKKAAEKKARSYKRKARKVTPLIKYWGGEESVRMARMNMQILGGIGYIKETGAEKILRDALVIPVYEGTSQIQALMALKDNLQAAIRNPARFLSEVASARLDSLGERDPLERGEAKLRAAALSGMQTILTRIAADKLGDVRGRPVTEWRKAFMKEWDPNKDFSFGLLHAERLCQLITWAAMADTLLRQANAAKGTADYDDRRDLCVRFCERYEPRARGLLAEIEATSGSLLQRLAGKKKRTEKHEKKAAE